jgi:SNF2 family DNA or RNA helicase
MNFSGKLYPYQKKCLRWMLVRETSQNAPGGFLLLDMGLGKTIMTIATICINQLDHTLIVVPKNVVDQWVSEFKKFTGREPLVVTASMSNGGHVTHDMIRQHPVVITPLSTFESMKDVLVPLMTFEFDRLVVDEAHRIRNSRAKGYRLLKQIQSTVKWCLTGTLINKNRGDFVSLLEFMSIYDVNLAHAARTYIFRLTKEDVNVNIPDLSIEDLRGDFETVVERDAYEDILQTGKLLLRAYKTHADGEGRMRILEQLLRLRQAVTNIRLLPSLEFAHPASANHPASTKLAMLERDIRSSPVEKTLIFCHWTKEIESIVCMLGGLGHKCVILSGKTRQEDRDQVVATFSSDPSVNFFVVQIDAGGVGLNIQAASRVYINSLAWNATTELQAIARAHRIGQKKKVVVKRLVINNSIDERILDLQQKKLSVASDILGDRRIEGALQSRASVAFHTLLGVFR